MAAPDWKEVEKLVSEQKLEAAAEVVDRIEVSAREAGNDDELTRALIRKTQIRIALHGYETAVRSLAENLRAETPGRSEKSRAILGLFYGRTLMLYLESYSWEIQQREKVETSGPEPLDLRLWTAAQIQEEIQRAYAEVWSGRGAWGDRSIGELSEYLQSNTYPAHIRGTLRDAVTYLWVELLANSSFWSPAQSNYLHRLDADAMASDAQLFSGDEADLADPDIHPLQKIRWILADLEAWHAEMDRPEAAFEARSSLLQVLSRSLTRDEDRTVLRADLEKRLETLGRRYPWWSMGMSRLAEMHQADRDAGDALIRAREVALEGMRAHPESPGGQRCQHLVASIERPMFQVRSMAQDGLDRRSLEVLYSNQKSLSFRAYAIDFPQLSEGSTKRSIRPDFGQVQQWVENGSPIEEWTVDLPPTLDYRQHRTFVTPPLDRQGAYLIVASARQDFHGHQNYRTAVVLTISDLVPMVEIGSGESGDQVSVTVVSGRTGQPISGAEVIFYRLDWRKGHHIVRQLTTGDDGRADTGAKPLESQAHAILVEKDGEQVLAAERIWPSRQSPSSGHEAALLFTDRSVYRPGQEVLWKTIVYRAEDENRRFSTRDKAPVTVELVDPNGESIASQEVTTNDFGSASGRFTIPAGRLLGSWYLRTDKGGHTGVKVEEYKRPTFEVTVANPSEPVRLNREVVLEGDVAYYFGLPVSAGEVSYTVSREPVWPRWWWRPTPGGTREVIGGGQTTLDAEGHFEVRFTPEADERLADQTELSYRYRVSIDVTDTGGETRSTERAFRVGFVAVQASFDLPGGYLRDGKEVEIGLRRTSLDGEPAPGAAKWRLVRLEEPREAALPADLPALDTFHGEEPNRAEKFLIPGDRLRPRWQTEYQPQRVLELWSDGEAVASGEVVHDDSGMATLETRLAEGAYRLHYETEDAFGARLEHSQELLVGPAKAGAVQDELPLAALLEVEDDEVEVGETVRVWLGSGLENQTSIFEVHRGKGRIERRQLDRGMRLLEIPVEASDRGGITFRLRLVRDHQPVELETRVDVPWSDRRLELSFSTFRDRLRPGTEETFKITVKNWQDNALEPKAAELLAYMYDRSLDLFASHTPFDPVGLYPRNTVHSYVQSPLGMSQVVWQQALAWNQLPGMPRMLPTRLKFYDGWPIGGPGRRLGLQSRAMSMATADPQRGGRMAPPAVAKSMPMEAMANQESMDLTGDVVEEMVVEGEAGNRGGDGSAGATEELRSDFAETAFWFPHLLLEADGAVSFEFTVPDSVTEWDVWAHAITRDLRAGSAKRSTKSVKELLVRPYLPRFLREGDQAEIRVVVSNAGDSRLTGKLDLDLQDPETNRDRLLDFGLTAAAAHGVPFEVEPGKTATLRFPLTAPSGPGPLSVKVVGRATGTSAEAGGEASTLDVSDGELRPLPILPSRLHLAQSRFAVLREPGSRELRFEDLAAGDDPSLQSESLVITLDGQLLMSVLRALPYLVEYPYQCTEQTLNRFLSTGIVSRVFDDHPMVAEWGKDLASGRQTELEPWEAEDPNRRLLLEETPWLRAAKGGESDAERLRAILDPEVARAVREKSLADLREAQTASGGFPWWPGGPPSPFMTLYLLDGFARALEHGVEVPQDMVVRAWKYMADHWRRELGRRLEVDVYCCVDTVAYLAYVLSSYPDGEAGENGRGETRQSWTGGVLSDDDLRQMVDMAFDNWRKLPPRVKGFLSLALHRQDRKADARLVWNSVMDSAKTDPDLGTYWAPEERAWLFYNDTVETHAFALRVLQELDPADERRHGLAQWLLLDKKLGHWKSTRATAEAIYALVQYLEKEEMLAIREEADVRVGKRSRSFVFEPGVVLGNEGASNGEAGSGAVTNRRRWVIPGDEVSSEMATIEVEKSTPGFLFTTATWHFATDRLPEQGDGDLFAVERSYFRRSERDGEWVLEPLADGTRLEVGDQVEVHLSLSSRHQAEFVHLRDPRGAGFEPEDTTSGYRWDVGVGHYREIRDSATHFFFDYLPVGEVPLKYRLRATVGGIFRVGPAEVQSMYAPEFVAYSSGRQLRIEGE